MYEYISIYPYIHIRKHINTYIHAHRLYTYVYTPTRICIYIYIHIFIYSYLCIFIHIYTFICSEVETNQMFISNLRNMFRYRGNQYSVCVFCIIETGIIWR